MDQTDEDDLPLRDEAKARPEWRGRDEEAEGAGAEAELDRASKAAEARLLKDVAQRPPD